MKSDSRREYPQAPSRQQLKQPPWQQLQQDLQVQQSSQHPPGQQHSPHLLLHQMSKNKSMKTALAAAEPCMVCVCVRPRNVSPSSR
mmetsp:Transcript_73396/g.153151  ORF Transcript_73396/g.153151 Transcript_73396/m.153151 type:complete len:86 (+) Transcript_73396:92-349(+)